MTVDSSFFIFIYSLQCAYRWKWAVNVSHFLLFIESSEGCGFTPSQFYKLWICWKTKNNGNWIFMGSEGNKGRQGWEMHDVHIVVCDASLSLTPHFFNFGITTGVAIPKMDFEKEIFNSWIQLKFQRLIWRFWWVARFFRLQVEVRKLN